jgi:hypothetical protein
MRRGDFTSREDLVTRITAFHHPAQQASRTYKWSYDADAEPARYHVRHPQPEPQTASPKPHDSNAQSPTPSQELEPDHRASEELPMLVRRRSKVREMLRQTDLTGLQLISAARVLGPDLAGLATYDDRWRPLRRMRESQCSTPVIDG